MRICLINPGKILQPQPPLGLCYIASYLRKYSRTAHNVKVADENTGENVRKTIKRFSPNVVGITATTPHITRAGEIASFVKRLDENIPVIVGGPHVSALPQETLNSFDFDIGVLRDGEETFKELVDYFTENGENINVEALSNISGLVIKSGEKFVRTQARNSVSDLDSIPPPARDLLDMDFYLRPEVAIRGHLLRATTIFTSRGCPFDCKFCASPFLTYRHIRFHSPEYVLLEIKSLCNDYPKLEGLFFLDDTFTLNHKRIEELCSGFLKEGLKDRIVWSCQGRVTLVKREYLPLYRLMKKAGCIQMEFGFESASDRVLHFIKGKHVNAKMNQEAIDIIKEAGMDIFGNFMVGIPTETRQEMLLTKEFIIKNLKKLDFFQTYFMTPYPGTKFWDDCALQAKANDTRFWQTFHSGYSGYGMALLKMMKDIDMNSAKDVEKISNYLAARQVSLKYRLTWVVSRLFYAPCFTLKKLICYFLYRIRKPDLAAITQTRSK